jgi:transcriptional regulator with XRE-family HTH domain
MDSPAAQEPTNASGVAVDGAEVRRRRELRGLGRTELAAKCDITPGYLSHIEKGRRRPSPPVFARICDALDVLDRRELLAERVAS